MTLVATAYESKITSGELQPDPAQAQAIAALADLETRLLSHTKKSGFLAKILKNQIESPKGLYIYGGVGRGKSLLMDCFATAISEKISTRRVHFHAFMHEVHNRLDHYRQSQLRDPLVQIAKEIRQKSRLLCFDEFFVQDITDAMILGRLFTLLFADGVIVVATSNIPIDNLYKNGLQRAQFVPFLRLFHQNMSEHHLDSPQDYRQISLNNLPRYFTPERHKDYEKAYKTLIAHLEKNTLILEVYGRKTILENHYRGLVRTSFDALCRADLGTADYLELAAKTNILFLDFVPALSGSDNDSIARRFLHLIDCLYEARCQLFLDLMMPLEQLYTKGKLDFEFQRCLSRLNEMQTSEYIQCKGA